MNLEGSADEELCRRVPQVEVGGLEHVSRRPHQHHRDRHPVRRLVPAKSSSDDILGYTYSFHTKLFVR